MVPGGGTLLLHEAQQRYAELLQIYDLTQHECCITMYLVILNIKNEFCRISLKGVR